MVSKRISFIVLHTLWLDENMFHENVFGALFFICWCCNSFVPAWLNQLYHSHDTFISSICQCPAQDHRLSLKIQHFKNQPHICQIEFKVFPGGFSLPTSTQATVIYYAEGRQGVDVINTAQQPPPSLPYFEQCTKKYDFVAEGGIQSYRDLSNMCLQEKTE